MNTIIIHVNNRVTGTPLHDHYAALISPVENLYLPPAPWWHRLEEDESEEKGLWVIEEAEEEYVECVECVDVDVEDEVEDVDVGGIAEYLVRVEAEDVVERASLVDEGDAAGVQDLNEDDASLTSDAPFELVQKAGRDEWDEKCAVIVGLEPDDDKAYECRFPDILYATDRGGHEIQSRRGRLATGDRGLDQDRGEDGSPNMGSTFEILYRAFSFVDTFSRQQLQWVCNSWLARSGGGMVGQTIIQYFFAMPRGQE